MIPFDLSLYLVTDRSLSFNRPMEKIVEEAVTGGATMVQLREKNIPIREFYEMAVLLKEILRSYHVPLIVNDRLDIALACDADGLHIGQSDIPYLIARRLLGPQKIIGLSVENLQDAIAANEWDVDYIGISPVFGTPTKTDVSAPLGLEGVQAICEISRHPAVGIGGMNVSNARDVIRAGADGIAVVSAIMSAESPKKSAVELIKIIKNQTYEME